MAFVRPRRVRFSDCDPAGIVFFPQYLVMVNGQVEDWLHESLGYGFGGLLLTKRIGLPTVHLTVDFKGISHLDDELSLSLAAERLGRRSFTLRHRILGADGGLRAELQQVLVTTSMDTHQAIDLPEDLRAAVERTLENA